MLSLTRRHVAASSAALLAGCATQTHTAATPAPAAPTAPAAPPPAIGAWGVDLAARDTSVKPGDDFYKYANGTWIAHTPIPADRTRWGAFDMLREKSDSDVKAIIEELSHNGGAAGSNEQKIAGFYNAYMNTDAIEQAGVTPFQADLAAIAALRTKEQAIRLIGRPDVPVDCPIALGVNLDARNPNRYIVGMGHAGLGLPEREYYLRQDAQFAEIRTQYVAHVTNMLTLAHYPDPAGSAHAIMDFETKIAQRHWPIADRRDVIRTYNLKTRAQIKAIAPAFPWDAYFDSAGMGAVTEVVVAELSAMGPLATLFMSTPMPTIRAYLTYHYLTSMASIMPKAFDDENFAFYGHTLNGQPQQRERWKRAVAATNGALGEAVGQIYVSRHFPPSSKAQMQQLVENLRNAYKERITALTWMTAATKAAAQEKLHTFNPKIGYPDKWRDYSALEIRGNDAFGNFKRNAVYVANYDLARLPRPTDKGEWFMTPQTVNAYYNPTFNEVVFPAAILQPPFFDPNADMAVNYGGIGAVIGHEMGHGFDDQGAKSDAQGVLRDWWTPADEAAFNQLVTKLANQYNGYAPLPGINVNGRLTSGENIGDNGGMQASHYAYHIALQGQTPPAIDGFTGEQRFFMGFAQIWRANIRDAAVRNQVMTDPHSPSQFRCNGTVRNMEAWYTAFNVQPGDALYLAPADRVLIW